MIHTSGEYEESKKGALTEFFSSRNIYPKGGFDIMGVFSNFFWLVYFYANKSENEKIKT